MKSEEAPSFANPPPSPEAAQLLYPTFASSLDVCAPVVLTQPSGLYSFVFVASQAPRTLRLNPLCVASGRVYPSLGAALRLLPGAQRRPRPSREPGCARRLDGSGSPGELWFGDWAAPRLLPAPGGRLNLGSPASP